MKKRLNYYWSDKPICNCYKLPLIMKITTFLLFCTIGNLMAFPTYSQNTKISLDMKGAPIESVLNKIEEISEFYFLFNQKLIDVNRKVDVVAEDRPIKDILNEIFDDDVKFIVSDRQIVLTRTEILFKPDVLPQQQTVTGRITDASTGEPMPGVNIQIKGTTIGTVTDAEGKYSLPVTDKNAILSFSFIGYIVQEINLNSRTSLDVALASDLTQLEEVVVVGYGTQKKVNLTGAVTQVTAEEFQDRPINRMTQALQGVIPNLNVVFGSGKPGQSGSLNIRGNTSINGGAPLVIIDGVPGNIDRINVYDVESDRKSVV